MNWWGWATWGLTTAIALGGLVLGIRAERRASRYKPHWSGQSGNPIRMYNRTGEDASNVQVVVGEGRRTQGRLVTSLVQPDEAVTVHFISAQSAPDNVPWIDHVRWVRTSTGRTYQTGERWLARQRRWRREALAGKR